MPHEDIISVRGKKKIKDRISLVVCANATGTHKIPCTLIEKPKVLVCIINRQCPITYYSQRKAWMDRETCEKWYEEVFVPEVKKRTGRHVLLLLDGAPGHIREFERDNIRIVFFPANCTA
jgi:hypothetical protein